MQPIRILAIASAGGHWIQLSRLSPLFDHYDTQFVTTLNGVVPPSGEHPVLTVPDASRNEPLRLMTLWMKLVGVMLRFRPHVVVTTGAAPGLIALQTAKLIGARTIWIDSIANAAELSMSGKLASRVADLWLTQWEELAAATPRLQYFGKVI